MIFEGENILENESADFNTDKKKYVRGRKSKKIRRGSHFTRWYNFYFERVRLKELNILEIGVAGGGSLNMWKNFFPNSEIYGIDIDPKKLEGNRKGLEGINVSIGDQSDKNFLDKVLKDVSGGLDIIIDDGSHMTHHQVASFEYLFEKLNSGGIYVIEDIHTSYRSRFKKKPHKSAVDYLKRRIDDVNVGGKLERYNEKDILEQTAFPLNFYEKTIESIHFYPDICFIFKR